VKVHTASQEIEERRASLVGEAQVAFEVPDVEIRGRAKALTSPAI
jgi:hypothetical protein